MTKEEAFEKAKSATNEIWQNHKNSYQNESQKRSAYAVMARCWKTFKADLEAMGDKAYWDDPISKYTDIESSVKGTDNYTIFTEIMSVYMPIIDILWKTTYKYTFVK